MPRSAHSSSMPKPLILGGLVVLLVLAAGWILGSGAGAGGRKIEQAQEDSIDESDDRFRGVMPSVAEEPDPAIGSGRKAVVTPFFGAVTDAATDESVPFLDLVVHHWPDWNSNLGGTPEQNVNTLTRAQVVPGSKNGISVEYDVQTDKYGEFQVGLSELSGHIALSARDGAAGHPVAMAEGAFLWLENLAKGGNSRDNPLGFTCKIGPTIAINLTRPGERNIEDVLEESRLAALGEAPEFFAYIDAGADTRMGVDWYQVRHNEHPDLERIYLEAFTPAGFPQRVSHTAPWIRLPAPLDSDRKPNGKALELHVQNREGTLAGSSPMPGIVGIIPDNLAMGVTERGVVFGKVLGATGLAFPGARIHLQSLGEEPLGFDRGMGERLVTSSGGKYRLECIPAGAWQVQVWGGSSLLLRGQLRYEPGEVTELDLDLESQSAYLPEVILNVGLPKQLSKEQLRKAKQFFRGQPIGDAILASFRPLDEDLRAVIPTVPTRVILTSSKMDKAEFAVVSPPLPEGTYELMLGRNPSSTSDGYFQWDFSERIWDKGSSPLEITGYPVAAPWGWTWTDPISGQPLKIQTHFPIWWGEDGPIGSVGLDASPDAEAYLTRLAGQEWGGARGQRLVGLSQGIRPVLEPQSAREQGDLDSAEPLAAASGWGAAIKVRLHKPAGNDEEDLGPSSGFFDKDDPGPLGLPGATILFDGAFATRTDGSGRALIGAALAPSRLQVEYPGYHQLEIKDDPTQLPLGAPPIDQLVYQVLLVRD